MDKKDFYWKEIIANLADQAIKVYGNVDNAQKALYAMQQAKTEEFLIDNFY